MSLINDPIVSLEQVWGDDKMVVNSARVSFGKKIVEMREADERLINYLAKHNHFSPFRHAGATFVLTCPIAIARQIHKHQVGVSINEMSGRYVTMNRKDYYVPGIWREADKDVKQGSKDTPAKRQALLTAEYVEAVEKAYDVYEALVAAGACREQARMVLPQGMLTQFYMSGTLQAWAHFCKLRLDSHAQKEIRKYAVEISIELENAFPVSWKALKEHM